MCYQRVEKFLCMSTSLLEFCNIFYNTEANRSLDVKKQSVTISVVVSAVLDNALSTYR